MDGIKTQALLLYVMEKEAPNFETRCIGTNYNDQHY